MILSCICNNADIKVKLRQKHRYSITNLPIDMCNIVSNNYKENK